LYNPDRRGEGSKKSGQYTLHKLMLSIVKMMAPIMPYITEEIYQTHFKKNEKDKSIHISKWPESEKNKVNVEQLDLFLNILGKVRQEKSNAKKSMKAEIILTIEKGDYEKIKEMLDDLKSVTNAKDVKIGNFKVEFV